MAEVELPRCRCGYTRRDRERIAADCDYSAWGWFQLMLLGGSAVPKRVRFRCLYCGETFDTIDDSDTLRREAGTLY